MEAKQRSRPPDGGVANSRPGSTAPYGRAGPGELHSRAGPGELHSRAGPGELHSRAGPGELHSRAGPGELHSRAGPGELHIRAGPLLDSQPGSTALYGRSGRDELHSRTGSVLDSRPGSAAQYGRDAVADLQSRPGSVLDSRPGSAVHGRPSAELQARLGPAGNARRPDTEAPGRAGGGGPLLHTSRAGSGDENQTRAGSAGLDYNDAEYRRQLARPALIKEEEPVYANNELDILTGGSAGRYAANDRSSETFNVSSGSRQLDHRSGGSEGDCNAWGTGVAQPGGGRINEDQRKYEPGGAQGGEWRQADRMDPRNPGPEQRGGRPDRGEERHLGAVPRNFADNARSSRRSPSASSQEGQIHQQSGSARQGYSSQQSSGIGYNGGPQQGYSQQNSSHQGYSQQSVLGARYSETTLLFFYQEEFSHKK